ncbi:hypothetical protein ACHAXT_003811 [Thalassiosira profunda]
MHRELDCIARSLPTGRQHCAHHRHRIANMTMPHFDMRPAPPAPTKTHQRSVSIGELSAGSAASGASSGIYPAPIVAAARERKSAFKATGRPIKLTKSISFDRATKLGADNHSLAGADPPEKGAFALPPGAVPVSPDAAKGGMPQLVYMMPSCGGGRCGSVADNYSCAGDTHGYSCGGDTTLNTSYGSMDSACERPLTHLGKTLKRGGRVFMNAVRETLDYGEVLCNPANHNVGSDPVGKKHRSRHASSGASVVSQQSTVMTEEKAEKVGEVLRVMKESGKEGQTAEEKTDAKTHQRSDSMGAQILTAVKDNLAVLNESAITHASELLGLGGVDPPDELLMEPKQDSPDASKVDLEAETPRAHGATAKEAHKKQADELALEFNANGLSISGEDKENVDPSAKKEKKPKRGLIKGLFKDITGSTKNAAKPKRAGKKEPIPFANFTSVDAMGFPSPSAAAAPPVNAKDTSWQADFDAANPFASTTPAAQQTTKFSPSEAIETKICAWCKKGGKSQPEVVAQLKLCSRCQATYYCGAECQGKDWANGHATSCQPNSVAMY